MEARCLKAGVAHLSDVMPLGGRALSAPMQSAAPSRPSINKKHTAQQFLGPMHSAGFGWAGGALITQHTPGQMGQGDLGETWPNFGPKP